MRGAQTSARDKFNGMKSRNRNSLEYYKPTKPLNMEPHLEMEAQFNTPAICENNWGQGQTNSEKPSIALLLNLQLLKHLDQPLQKTAVWNN